MNLGRKAGKSRAIVVHPELPKFGNYSSSNSTRSAEARLEEAVGLTAAIDLEVAVAEIFKTRKIRSSTLISGSAVE
ncbi:MAG: GTPase HflX, partial [Alphaproteobacteria bacterium]